jgi:hypothetical protein
MKPEPSDCASRVWGCPALRRRQKAFERRAGKRIGAARHRTFWRVEMLTTAGCNWLVRSAKLDGAPRGA